MMTPVGGALDWLAVGDVAEDRNGGTHSAIGGAAARLAEHAAALGASTALVGKVGDDDAGRRLQAALTRLKIDIQWLRVVPGVATTVWRGSDGQPERRVERGADLNLRLDELPSPSVAAALTVVSGYSLAVEPARSAAMGALAGASARGGRAALLVEAELLWAANARITRRVLEPAIAAAHSIALREADARVLLGAVPPRQALRLLGEMGPKVVFLSLADGSVMARDGGRIHTAALPEGGRRRDRYAAPAAFWVALARRQPVAQAAVDAVRHAGPHRIAAAKKR